MCVCVCVCVCVCACVCVCVLFSGGGRHTHFQETTKLLEVEGNLHPGDGGVSPPREAATSRAIQIYATALRNNPRIQFKNSGRRVLLHKDSIFRSNKTGCETSWSPSWLKAGKSPFKGAPPTDPYK